MNGAHQVASALKAFITARKPRALEARNLKAMPYRIGESGAQESGSSSADNGDPQTPSSQCSERPPTETSIIIHHSDDENALSSQPMDPHFARLLNSLSLSAKHADAKPVPPPSQSAVQGISHQPVYGHESPATASPILDCIEPSLGLQARSSKYSPGRMRGHVKEKYSPSQDVPAHMRRLDQTNGTSTASTTTVPLTASHNALGASWTAPVSSTVSADSSLSMVPKQASSRRSSSITDISPYLIRPTEVAFSGKRLKQLALLESVADESSKMTPTLMNCQLPAIPMLDRHPGPCASVPPATSCGLPSGGHSRHDSRGSLQHGRAHQTISAHAYPVLGDPFQVRPRSTQLSCLDAICTGSPPHRAVPRGQFQSVLANVEPRSTSPAQSPSHPYASASTTFRPPIGTGQATLPRPPPSGNAQLLSILNSGPRPRGRF